MTRRGPFVINAARSAETAQALRELADLADKGDLIGFALTGLHQNRSKDFVCTAGAANYAPDRVVFWLKRLIVSLIRN